MLAGVLAQQSQSFTISIDASVVEATQLFGPVRETEWNPGWRPAILHPEGGAQRPGVVFTQGASDHSQLWTLTDYDEQAGRVAYVIVEPGLMISEIQIRVSANGPGRSRAMVMERRSALSESANQLVSVLTAPWAVNQRQHWEAAINGAVQRARQRD